MYFSLLHVLVVSTVDVEAVAEEEGPGASLGGLVAVVRRWGWQGGGGSEGRGIRGRSLRRVPQARVLGRPWRRRMIVSSFSWRLGRAEDRRYFSLPRRRGAAEGHRTWLWV